ncbi:unnamed protein product, partial [marine sediment metagenome]
MKKRVDFIKLRVQEARKRDIGHNTIRIDQNSMNKLNIQTGDVIEIVGEKQSAGIAWPSYPQDADLGIVRIDSRLQKNTGTRVDDLLEVRKVKAEIAQSIRLAPDFIRLPTNLRRFETFVKRKLGGLPVALHDYICISLSTERDICFKVINLKPKGICVIKPGTVLTIDESKIFEKILSIINSLFEEQDVHKITIQRKYLPEIFSSEMLDISKNDGFPTLKSFLLEYLMEHGITVKFSIHDLKFK